MKNLRVGRVKLVTLFLGLLAAFAAPDSYAGKFAGSKVKQRIVCATALTCARCSEDVVELGPDDAIAFYTKLMRDLGGTGNPRGSVRQGVYGNSASPSIVQDRVLARIVGLVSDIGVFRSNWTIDVKDIPETYPANLPKMLVVRVLGREKIKEFIIELMIFSYKVSSLSSIGVTLLGDLLNPLTLGAVSSLLLPNYNPNFEPSLRTMLEMVGAKRPEKPIPEWVHYGVTSRSSEYNDEQSKALEFALNLRGGGPSCPGLSPFVCRYLYWLHDYSRGVTKMDIHLSGSSSSFAQELYIAWRADRPSLPSQHIQDWISLGMHGPI